MPESRKPEESSRSQLSIKSVREDGIIRPSDLSRKSQAEKFKDLAREVEAEQDETKFDAALRRMVNTSTAAPKEQEDEQQD